MRRWLGSMKSLRRLVVNWNSVESLLWRSNGSSIVSLLVPDVSCHSTPPAMSLFNPDFFNSRFDRHGQAVEPPSRYIIAPPFSDSGPAGSNASVWGGRTRLRAVLYMGALVASRHNPVPTSPFTNGCWRQGSLRSGADGLHAKAADYTQCDGEDGSALDSSGQFNLTFKTAMIPHGPPRIGLTILRLAQMPSNRSVDPFSGWSAKR